MAVTSCVEDELQRYDVIPRKVHQYAMIVLIAAGFVLAGNIGAWLLLAAAIIMAFGRFWSLFDLFRVLTWDVLQPAGILPRQMVHEDRATRRIARVLGGIVFAISAALLILAPSWSGLAWGLTAAVGVMILLDAAFDFCVLCFVVHHYQRLTGAGRAPAGAS